jgi:hypothetical protein
MWLAIECGGDGASKIGNTHFTDNIVRVGLNYQFHDS